MNELGALFNNPFFAELAEVSVLGAGAIAGGVAHAKLNSMVADKLPQWARGVLGLGIGALIGGFGLRGRIGTMSYGRYASRAMIGVGIGFAVKSFKDVVQPVASKLGINQSFEFLGSLGADDTMLLGDSSSELYNRYLGAAPLKEDNSVRSAASTTLNLRVLRQMSESLDLALDVLNLSDRRNNDISYVYTSRLAGEPAAGVEGLHVHPAEPRSLRLTARLRF